MDSEGNLLLTKTRQPSSVTNRCSLRHERARARKSRALSRLAKTNSKMSSGKSTRVGPIEKDDANSDVCGAVEDARSTNRLKPNRREKTHNEEKK